MSMLRIFVRVDNDAQLGERQIRIVASDATVDRVGDVMVAAGCDISDYLPNPIILAQHDPHQPIGKCAVEITDGSVVALIDFPPPGVSARADEYCGLAKNGIINAASVGFEPVEFEPIKGGGRRYTKWKLMEISLVSVPANPSALVVARSLDANGVAARKQIKVGASLNMPGDVRSVWSGEAAARRIFEKSGFDSSEPNSAWARKAFLIHDAANPNSKDAYQLPFADVVDGRLTATLGGLRAAAAGLATMTLPDDVRAKAQNVLDHYEAKMTGIVRRKSGQSFKIKGLYDCAELAQVLSNLGWIHDRAKWEQEVEQDDSKLPAMLGQLLLQGGAALIAMTQEEVGELLAGHDVELPDDDDYVEAAATPQAKALRAAFRKAGRVLSRANQDHLDAIAKCFGKMMDCRTKAADLHDDLHDQIVAMEGHGTSLGEHLKALQDSADDSSDDDNQDDSGDDGDDPENTDGELAYGIEQRKRALAILES